MTFLIRTCGHEEGSAIVLALVFLVVLTLIGVFSSRTATIDIQIASNEIPYHQNFYIANALVPQTLATQGSGSLPAPAHQVAGNSYAFQVDYLGFFSPPAGYSSLHFSRYDYNISAAQGGATVRARYFKIGPKAE